jgi:hypothetical protein
MKHVSAIIVAAPLFLLAACGASTQNSVSLDDNLKNPLYAQHYYEDMSEQMVSLELNKDPVLKDASKKSIVDNARIDATKRAQDAVDLKTKGLNGVNVMNNTLYFGTDFIVSPGPSLHVFLSNVIDPRQVHFPDPTAVDLGSIKTAYGAQAYPLPESTTPKTYRSLALWDNALGTFYGFAQLQGH